MSSTSSTMTFHEMSLLQMQFQLDETREWITDLHKSQNEIQWEIERKLIEEKELDAKIKRFKRILKSIYKSGAYSPEKQSALLPKHHKQNIPEKLLHSPPPLLYLNQHHHRLLNKKVQNKNNNPHLLHHNKHQMTNGQWKTMNKMICWNQLIWAKQNLILPTKTLH